MHRFTLRQLEYLVACIDQGSIARAAEVLNVAQPTVSVAIGKLEDQFGTQLLLRHHSQGVSPTTGAEKLLHSARGLLRHASDLQRQAMDEGTTVAGNLRLGSFITLAPVVLPGLIEILSRDFPAIKLGLNEGTQEGLVEGLKSGQLDMALLYDLGLPDGLRLCHLTELQPYVALPADHPLTRHAAVSLADLTDVPMILLDVPPSREYFLGLFTRQGLQASVAYSSPSLELVRGMVGRGLGFSLLVTRPQSDLTYDGHAIAVRPISGDVRASSVVLASPENLRPTQVMRAFQSAALQFFHKGPGDQSR